MYDNGLKQSQSQPTAPSLTAEMSRLNDRLISVLGRAHNIADLLHGPQPHGVAEDNAGADKPPPVLRRFNSESHDIIGDIERELLRIENGL